MHEHEKDAVKSNVEIEVSKNLYKKYRKRPFSVGMVVASCVLISLFILFCITITPILFPFIFSFIFAYIATPLVKKLARYKIPTGLSSALIVLLFFGFSIFALSMIVPVAIHQAKMLLANLPIIVPYLQNNVVSPIVLHIAKYIDIDQSAFMLDGMIMQKLILNAKNMSQELLHFALLSSGSAFYVFSILILTPILCFYTLSSFDSLNKAFLSIIPLKYKVQIVALKSDIRSGIQSYIKGQILAISIMSLYYSLALKIAGLKGAVILGILTGIFGIVPYLGVLACSLIGVLMAFYQFGNNIMPLIVFVLFISGQILDGSLITPNIIGNKIGVNPAIIIFGFLVCGTLFGFWGVLLAVPITLIFYIVVKFAVNSIYKKSEYYNL